MENYVKEVWKTYVVSTLMSMRDRNDLEQPREHRVAAWQKPSDFVYQAQISEDY